MADTKTYKAIYEFTMDDVTSKIKEVVTLPVEVAEKIIEKIETLAEDNEMVNVISIEEVEEKEESENTGIISGFLVMFGK